MKKIILSAIAISTFGFASAQETESTAAKGFNNGDAVITGSVGFSSQKTGDMKSNSFTLTPAVGFFVSDNIMIGGQLGYTSTTEDQDIFNDGDLYEVKTNAFEVGAFGRYYATPKSDFSLFAELGIAYATAKQEVESFEGESKVNGFGIGFTPGISYFIGSNWAIEATIGELSYTSFKPDNDGAESTDTFTLNLDLSNITFGVLYKF